MLFRRYIKVLALPFGVLGDEWQQYPQHLHLHVHWQ